MSTGDFRYVDEIEAGIDVGGKLTVEEIDDDAAGGRWLYVHRADGGGGIEDDHLLPGAGRFDSDLFAEEFGPLVVSNHVGKGNGGGFVDDGPIGFEAHGGDAGRVDGARDGLLASDAQEGAGSVDVGGVHAFWVAHPEAIVGGNMHQCVAATD